MSSSSQYSIQRRARLAAKRQTVYLLNVSEDQPFPLSQNADSNPFLQAYKYVLRTAYLEYLLDPATQAKLHPRDAPSTQPKPQPSPTKASSSSTSSAFGLLDLSSSKDARSNKFPKELVQILRDRLQLVFMGRDPKYQDQLVRATFGAFYNHYVEPNFFKAVKENRKIEEIILIFYSKASAELKKRIGGDEWRPLVDEHMALFFRMIQDCMKENQLAASSPDLMARLASYESKLLSGTDEVLEPEAPARQGQEAVPEISYSIKDMPLVPILAPIFNKTDTALQKDINHLRILASEKAAMQDLKTYMKDLNTATVPALRRADFPDEISYEEWKREESKAISQLIGAMVEANPLLAKSEPTEVRSSLLSETADKSDLRRTISENTTRYSVDVEQLNIMNGRQSRPEWHRGASSEGMDDYTAKSTYTFVPEDPRAYYRKLLDLSLRARKAGLGVEEEEESALFTSTSRALLTECATRWRVHPAARIALLLDIVREQYDAGDLDIGDVNEAFALADNWDYSSWPIADKLLFARVLASMHESLLRDLYNILQRVFDPKPLNPKPILLILNQHIYSNPLFTQTEPDLTNYISELKIGITNTAMDVYKEKRAQLLDESELDLIHVHDFVDGFINDFDRINKRFKDPILGEVDILLMAVDIFVPLVLRDTKDILLSLVRGAKERNEVLPREDMFTIYKKVKEIRDLYRRIIRKELPFEAAQTIFGAAISEWLLVTDTSTVEWIDRAVHGDAFKPENDDMKQSTSVMDLFQIIGGAVDFLKDLEWPDELQYAQYATRLANIIDKAIGHYCMMMERGFAEEMAAQEDLSTQQADHQGWMNRIRGAIAGDEKAEPFHFKQQSLVRLNNIQFALRKLDALQNTIDVENFAAVMERHAAKSNGKRPEKQNFIFTIKIVSAEDLKPCDVNGLSDPYVVLTDEHGRRIAKTRTIWGDLNPRWDESFDVSTTGSLWLAATVWDRDRMVMNHDLCGRCHVKLDPGFFGDYLPRDLWLDLDTQGKLLLRVSMEGEKDDIQFYFGRAFRALKRAESDMSRKVVDTMTTYSRHCLSTSVIRKLLSTPSTQRITSWLGKASLTSSAAKPAKQGLTDGDIEKAIDPLIDYFESNFGILDESLSKVSSVLLMGKLWKAVLGMFEDLLLPPLSDKPSRKRQLSEPEVDIIYKWLGFLRNYFYAGGEGVPMDVLTSLKYNEILSVRFFYDETTERLIRESAKIADQAYQQYEQRASKPIPVAFSQPKSVLKYRSLGTIKLHKARKRDAKQKDPNDDVILRILRMRPGAENYLKERFRQKNRLAATAAVDGVLRGPRR